MNSPVHENVKILLKDIFVESPNNLQRWLFQKSNFSAKKPVNLFKQTMIDLETFPCFDFVLNSTNEMLKIKNLVKPYKMIAKFWLV